MKKIVSVSFGKDSLAMLLRLLEEEPEPDFEVVYYNTGMEFDSVYRIRDRVEELLKERGVRYTELHPRDPFLYLMLDKPVYSRQKGFHYGYGWCGGPCRWGTRLKLNAIKRFAGDAEVYVGIAYDEAERTYHSRDPRKKYPLVEWEMTEADCLAFCHERGYFWEEEGIELYSILSRLSCWCCGNKNKSELFNLFRYGTKYWNQLLELQARTERPMKNYHNEKYGEYGDLFVLEKVFEEKLREEQR